MKKTLLVLTLGVFVASAGTALAGTTFVGLIPSTPVTVARETFKPATTFLVPAVGTISRTLSVVPVIATVYFLDLNIGTGITGPADATQTGVTFTGAGAIPLVSYIPGTTGCGVLTATPAAGPSTTHMRWSVSFSTSCTSPPTLTVTGAGGPVNFTDINDLRGAGLDLAAGVSIKEQLRFLDSFSQTEFPADAGSTTPDFIVDLYATSATVIATTATIDLTTQAKNFVINTDPDTITTDVGASITPLNAGTYYDWAGPRGAFFSPAGTTLGFYNVKFTSSNRDFTGVTSVTVGGSIATSATPLTTRNWSFSNAVSAAAGLQAIVSTISGLVPQLAGSFTITADYWNGVCAGGSGTTCTATGTLQHSLPLLVPTYTVWTLNGTVLFAPMVNGNTAAFMQRFYVCAPLSAVTAATFDVIITTVPVIGSTSTYLGPPPDGTFTVASTLNPGGCMNIKLETLLGIIGVSTPYTADGGNLAIKLSFHAPNVIGIHQSTNLPITPGQQPSSFVTAPMVRLNKSLISDPGL